jgi:maltokinase
MRPTTSSTDDERRAERVIDEHVREQATDMSDIDAAALAGLFEHWLPGQRWYAGKSRPVESIRPRSLGSFGDPPTEVELWLADVSYVDGGQETYQVPLRFGTDFDDALDHARLGQVNGADGQTRYVYDALWDRPHSQEWLRALLDGGKHEGLDFHLTTTADAVPVEVTGRVLTGEQSNTSLVFGDQAILKVFRRLEVGTNPDIEVHEALGRVGGRHIAGLLGYITADFGVGQGNFEQLANQDQQVSLAMLQEFMAGATDGWELAKNSVRDLMAEADLHAAEAGGDFASEAFRLGRATAEVHADLVTAMGTQDLTVADMRARADAMLDRLEETLVLVPDLARVADGLRASYEAFASSPPMTVQRVHGDLHLGQVLRTVRGWTVLDFEGEPVKSIANRREPDSPLRDVAGMLRSFDYAAYHQIVDLGSTSQRNYRAAEWADRNRAAFQAGYASAAGDPEAAAIDAPARPNSTDADVLLRAFEADKAVYEAAYEARNRPAWLAVPLASLGRLVAPTSPASGEDVR